MPRDRLTRLLLTGALAMATLTACDESFTPIAPIDLDFSVFGYLDASADTQWIRVTQIRPLAVMPPDSLRATVTVAHLGSGRSVALRDSLFRFTDYTDPEVGSEGVYVHNFWTTEQIEPGATYRLTLQPAGEEPSEAVVEIPRDYAVEVLLKQAWGGGSDSLRLSGLKHVPFVAATTRFYDRCGSFAEQVSFRIRPAEGDVQVIPISKATVPPREACGAALPEGRELWMVGSEAAWPTGQSYSTSALVPWEGESNISNAMGFIGGVLTKVLSYENCDLVGPTPLPDHCRLRYDATSASIRGTVTETRCGAGPFDSLAVQLWELKPPTEVRKVRTTRTNRSGVYEIGWLEAGTRYLLRAIPPTRRVDGRIVDLYTQHTDTLEFTPGEQRHYDIGLRKLDDCSVHW